MIYLSALDTWDQHFDPVIHKNNATFFCTSGSVVEQEDGDIIVPYFKARPRNLGPAWFASMPHRYFVLSEKSEADIEPVELARGRVHTLPTEMATDEVELEFICVPPNEDAVLKAAADALRVAEVAYNPNAPAADRKAAEEYDPLFFSTSASDDPSNVNLATLFIWRWDRKTLQPTRVHLIRGDNQYTVIGSQAGKHKSERLTINNPPKSVTKYRLIASFVQQAKGVQATPINNIINIPTYSPQEIINGLPRTGDAIGSSDVFSVAECDIVSITPMLEKTFNVNRTGKFAATAQKITMMPFEVNLAIRTAYDYEQPREEYCDILMPAGIQDVLGDDKTEAVDSISLGDPHVDLTTKEWLYEDPETLDRITYFPGDKRQANGGVFRCVTEHEATENFRASIFDGEETTILWQRIQKQSAMARDSAKLFGTDRGTRAIRHALLRLNRIVQRRARAAELSFEVDWKVARFWSTADELRVEHRKLMGGEVVGKIISIELIIAGPLRSAMVTIAISIGDGSGTPVPGPGQSQVGDIVYSVTAPAANEPVRASALSSMPPSVVAIENDAGQQEWIGIDAAFNGLDPVGAMGKHITSLRIGYPAIRQEDMLRRRVSVTCLPVPVRKGIDLTPDYGG